tara:strand:- start:10960 stop:12219 length:1260 start_codon:yes stop_codon:yes gene_type:complete
MKSAKEEEKATLTYINYWRTSREKQRTPEGNWNAWLILAGRGWGKTRTGAYDIVNYSIQNKNVICAVVAPTAGDLRRVCFEGVSGIRQLIPQELLKDKVGLKAYNKSTAQINLWNGSKIIGFSASEPDRLRGSQYHRAWCDELASWRYPEAYDQLIFGLRLGKKPQVIITTTPRPTTIIKKLFERKEKDVFVTQGNTFENQANLAQSALEQFKERYEGTRLGRQELYAEILEDIEGALWTHFQLDKCRIDETKIPDMRRIIVAVDPAVTAKKTSDETGIIVAGVDENDKYFILDDKSGKFSADRWASIVIEQYYKYNANLIVAETNNGGDLVEKLLRTIDRNVPYKSVTATRGKIIRAEPISALYEQKRVFHTKVFPELEDQMCSFTGDNTKSPDRLDALVWGLTELSSSTKRAIWRIS